MIDVRPVPGSAAGHVPGALSIPLRPVFASWLGWLAPHDRPLAIRRSPVQDPAEVAWQAATIGHTTLAGGIDAWTAAGHQVTRTRLVHAGRLGPEGVLDVRATSEVAAGHLPGASHVELGALAVLDGGPREWSRATGRAVETGA